MSFPRATQLLTYLKWKGSNSKRPPLPQRSCECLPPSLPAPSGILLNTKTHYSLLARVATSCSYGTHGTDIFSSVRRDEQHHGHCLGPPAHHRHQRSHRDGTMPATFRSQPSRDLSAGSDMPSAIEGFVCPTCMCRCASETALLAHFGGCRASGPDDEWEMLPPSSEILLTADAAEAPAPPAPKRHAGGFGKMMLLGKRAVTGSVGTSLFGGARALFSKSRAGTASAATATPPPTTTLRPKATNPSGQTFGATRRHTATFRTIRGQICATDRRREQQRLTIRCEKLQSLYRSTSALVLAVQKRALEQAAVPWHQTAYVPGVCDHCGGSLKLRGHDNCRLCGAVFCPECLLGVQTAWFGFPNEHGLDAAPGGPRGLSLVDSVPICVGSCITIAVPNHPVDAPAACAQLIELNGDLAALRAQLGALMTCEDVHSVTRDAKEAILALVAKAGRLQFNGEGNRRVQAKIKTAGMQLLQQSAVGSAS